MPTFMFLIWVFSFYFSSLIRFLRDNRWLIPLKQPVLLLISKTALKIFLFINYCLHPCEALFLSVVSEVPFCTPTGGIKVTMVMGPGKKNSRRAEEGITDPGSKSQEVRWMVT